MLSACREIHILPAARSHGEMAVLDLTERPMVPPTTTEMMFLVYVLQVLDFLGFKLFSIREDCPEVHDLHK
jgi:hypothetical protein